MTTDEHWLSRKEVAERLGVSIQTVSRWTREGRLQAYKGPGGQYRHKLSDIDSVVQRVEPSTRRLPGEEYTKMIEEMLGPAEAEGDFTYAKDEDW